MNRKILLVRKESFGFKVLSAFIIVIVFVLVTFTVFAVIREGNKAENDLKEQGEMLAGLLARGSVVGVFAENTAMLKSAAEGVMGLNNVVAIGIYNAGLKTLYRRNKQSSSKNASPITSHEVVDLRTAQSLNIHETPDSLEFIKPVILQSPARSVESLYFSDEPLGNREKVIGYVRIVLSKEGYHQTIVSIVKQNAVIMVIFICSSIVIVYFAVRKVIRPLEELTDTVKALGKGLPVEPVLIETKDEVGNLASAFNAMVVARARAEESLRESEHRFRMIAETITEVFWISKVDVNEMLYVSPGYERVWGRSQESLYEDPRSYLDAVHHEDRDRVLADLERRQRGLPFDHEYRIIRPDGSIRLIWDRGYPVRDATGGVASYVGVAQDITEHKGLEEKIATYQRELRSAALELSSLESRVEERERHLIAADLHDYVGQNLVVSLFKLGALKKSLTDPEGIKHLEEIREILNQTVQYTRSLTAELSPSLLVELGLKAAVEALAEEFHKTHGLSITVADDGLVEHPEDEARYLLFRCVRELLMNVVKHAKASDVNISIESRDDALHIIVSDNGIGFDPDKVSGKHAGFGLFSIRERMKRLGGACEIETGQGRGTRVVLATPRKLEQAVLEKEKGMA